MTNTDSSSHILKKKSQAIGKSSIATNTNYVSFKSMNMNDSNNARRRARSGGSSAPAKKSAY